MVGLRRQAFEDLSTIVNDADCGVGWPVVVTDPDGNQSPQPGGLIDPIYAITSDVSDLIDPNTGHAVSGRLATCAIPMQSLVTAGLGMPEGISNSALKPWVIQFNDIMGNPFTFKVQESKPDRMLGIVNCSLELYRDTL